MDEELLEPIKGYKTSYKAKNEKAIEDFFNDLVKKSGIDKAANKETVTEYKAKLLSIANINKRIKKLKALKTFIIVMMVLINAVGLVLLLAGMSGAIGLAAGIVTLVIGIGFLIFGIMIIKNKINKEIADQSSILAEEQKKANELYSKAWRQMAPLNALFDWGMTEQIFSNTIPLIKMDKYFDVQKYEYLHDKYGYTYSDYTNVSTCICQSGTILGNPFLICTDLCQYWRNHTYSGSIVIHWTETYRDSQGHTQTRHMSETLTAYVTEPEPYYVNEKYLIYGNDAAPNLHFSRSPSNANKMDDNDIKRFVAKQSKKLDKKARKAIKTGTNYTKLGNDEFECLFGGTDRDNEIEFRLLFTPLAQKNMLNLIKDKEHYGDDFYFKKDNKINIVSSEHSHKMDYFTTPLRYVSYDYEEIEKTFKEYNANFFKSVYFDLAPLMSIPLYQQHKSLDFIYNKELKTNVSHYEHESIANSFDKKFLTPEEADTKVILKSYFEQKIDKADLVRIESHSFNAEKRLTYVSVHGGDGNWHSVPVYWYEYIPVECENKMVIEEKNSTRIEYNNIANDKSFNNVINKISKNGANLFERGLFAALVGEAGVSLDDVNAINKVYQGAGENIAINENSIANTINKIEEALKKSEVNEDDELQKRLDAKLNDEKIEAIEKEHEDKVVEAEDVNDSDDDDDDDDDEE